MRTPEFYIIIGKWKIGMHRVHVVVKSCFSCKYRDPQVYGRVGMSKKADHVVHYEEF